ncbi:MAG: hypothetical protein ACRD19_05675 [Terriglobia bacterium]
MTCNPRLVQAERQILAALFQGFSDGPLEDSSKQNLADYRWQEPDHEALFSALVRFPSSHPSITAAEIPARLTRLGFPDVDCDFLKQPHGQSRRRSAELIRELLAENT